MVEYGILCPRPKDSHLRTKTFPSDWVKPGSLGGTIAEKMLGTSREKKSLHHEGLEFGV